MGGKASTPWSIGSDLEKAVMACDEIPAHKKPKIT